MKNSVNNNNIEDELREITQQIDGLVEKSKDDIFAVLLILQKLELLHRNIREEIFEPALPDNRHRLYLLIRHLEEVGGWPYIPRMRLRDICANFLMAESKGDSST